MKTLPSFALILAALTLPAAFCHAQGVSAGQAGDVVYSLELTDPASTLTNNQFFYNAHFSIGDGFVTGGFPDISYSDGVPQVVNVGNPFHGTVTSYGLLGIDDISGGATTNLSVYVGFNTASTVPVNESFTTFFAPFFDQHTDLTLDESTIVAALQDPNILDDDTADEGGSVLYQFRDYVIRLGDQTAAPIDTGHLTLVHFSDGTAFGDADALEIPASVPEPGTWALLGLGCAGSLGVTLRRRHAHLARTERMSVGASGGASPYRKPQLVSPNPIPMKKLNLIFATITAAAFCPSLHGAVVTSGGVTTVAGGGIAPGSNADYDFFGGGAQPVNLSDFTLTTPPPNQFNAAGSGITYSSLQPPGGGTVFSTGIAQPSTGAANAPFTVSLATYTLNSNEGANRAFSVYVLFGNTDGIHVFDQSISLGVNGGTAFTVPLTDTTQTNDFLRFNVTGLNAGDTLTVSATSSVVDAQGSTSNKPYIGGVDFALGVPEPSVWAAVLMSTGILVCVLRRRKAQVPG